MNSKNENKDNKPFHCPLHKKKEKRKMNCIDCPLCTVTLFTHLYHSSEILFHYIEVNYPSGNKNPILGHQGDCWKPPQFI